MSTDPPRRPRLNRKAVLRAATALADAEGLDAVTMRTLAERLGVVPMALYKHVADKEDLLDGMVDTLIDDMPRPPTLPADQWRSAIRATLTGAREIIAEHTWARRAIETRTERTGAVLGHMDRISGIFIAAGFSTDLTHHVMHLIGNRIWGFSPELFTGSESAPRSARRDPYVEGRRTRRRIAPDLNPTDYPAIVAIAADAAARRPGATGCDEDFEFAFALDVLLDGIGRLHDAGWSSA